jgi:RHS repeat-associated protein
VIASTGRKESLVTWVFDDGFVPTAKLTGSGYYSIISDFLGTPVEAYDAKGERAWSMELDIYGRMKELTEDAGFIPFRYQGQYADADTGLYYNRFRYYDPATGQYTQQDPIGLAGGNPTLYGYVRDTNAFVDIFGLAGTGGAYIYEFVNSLKYIGKGEYARMLGSILEQIPRANTSDLARAASISTGGNNTLGKMVEYKTMINARFDGRDIPQGFTNKYTSGKTAWDANPQLQSEATKIAEQLKAEFNSDSAVKRAEKINKDMERRRVKCGR